MHFSFQFKLVSQQLQRWICIFFQKIPILSIGGNCLKDVRKTCSIIMTLELTEVFYFFFVHVNLVKIDIEFFVFHRDLKSIYNLGVANKGNFAQSLILLYKIVLWYWPSLIEHFTCIRSLFFSKMAPVYALLRDNLPVLSRSFLTLIVVYTSIK